LHLVPLDALPLDEETLVGDRWHVETRATLTEFLSGSAPFEDRPELVLFGDVDYGAVPVGESEGDPSPLDAGTELVVAAVEPATRPPREGGSAGILRGGAWEQGFSELPGTGVEVRGIARAFTGTFGPDAKVELCQHASASRARLLAAAPRARWLHVATHGWFAPESIRSWSDPEPLDRHSGLGMRMSGEDQVKGMSPMLLCGFALAGANLPEDAVGRAPGLVTADELSTLDLSSCELAVLSACDTNVGERRNGQGVASLQKALHMAGARSVITSLWKVPDEATKELMLDFYRRIWVEKKPKQQALWEAKKRLRDAKDEQGRPRYSTRDWAAWVLTGEPE
jgi:CHAT domain-containing protein